MVWRDPISTKSNKVVDRFSTDFIMSNNSREKI